VIDEWPECPECGEDMVVRKNRKTGEQFYGCPNYPYCDGTQNMNEKPQWPDYPDWARSND